MPRTHPLLLAAALAWAPLFGAPAALAQTLADVMLTTAIASDLYPAVRFPASSLRATGAGTAAVIARVPDAAAWTGWEVYTATGFAASLEPALVYGVERDLFVEGFERRETTTTQEAGETVTRVVFVHADGRRALLTTFRSARDLVWLVARAL
jgi:hypothetical protein